MQVMHFDDAPVTGTHGDGFRSGTITFRDLLIGTEGAVDNFGLQMVDIPGGYSAPQHRHNFEQIRIMLDGSFGFGAKQVQGKGSVGYFCEGTRYTQNGEGKSTTLLLQLGGPSRQGFMSRTQLRQGIAQLTQRGQFNAGVYSWLDNSGNKHNQDSYEAVWEHVHQRKLLYPKPQYDGPVLFRPERFQYQAVAGQPGVAIKRLARFNEYGLEIAQLQIEAGASCLLDAASQSYLLFCLAGEGTLGEVGTSNGSAWHEWTSLRCSRGEIVSLFARRSSEFYLIGLPVFPVKTSG